jgi:hypothetical protein
MLPSLPLLYPSLSKKKKKSCHTHTHFSRDHKTLRSSLYIYIYIGFSFFFFEEKNTKELPHHPLFLCDDGHYSIVFCRAAKAVAAERSRRARVRAVPLSLSYVWCDGSNGGSPHESCGAMQSGFYSHV